MDNPKFASQILIAMSKDSFARAYISAFLASETAAIDCAASLMYAFQLIDLDMSVETIRTPQISGFLDEGLDELAQEGFNAFSIIMKAPLTYNLPGLSRGF